MVQFHQALPLDQLPENTVRHIDIEGLPIALYRVADKIYATSDLCTHKECLLSDGFLEKNIIECPCHGGKFDVTTGEVKTLPPTQPLQTYQTRINGQSIEVEL